MIIWHGFKYGYDAERKEWYALNTKTGERHMFYSYEDANRFVEYHRA